MDDARKAQDLSVADPQLRQHHQAGLAHRIGRRIPPSITRAGRAAASTSSPPGDVDAATSLPGEGDDMDPFVVRLYVLTAMLAICAVAVRFALGLAQLRGERRTGMRGGFPERAGSE
jgi:hypothetical protein